MEILVVGQSHLAAIRDAAAIRRARNPAATRARILHTLQPQFAPEIIGEDGAEGEGASFAPALAEEIAARIARRRPLVVSAIGGNAHNMLALIRHPRPFDFRLDDAIDAAAPPIDRDVEPIPLALVTAALARGLARDRLRLRLLSELLSGLGAGPLVHLHSPPPVADDRWIAARAEDWFATRGLATAGVAPAPLRHRMWRLASRLIAETVTALGGQVQPTPAAALDAAGYLRANFAGDATHGNAAYGEAVIAGLEERASPH